MHSVWECLCECSKAAFVVMWNSPLTYTHTQFMWVCAVRVDLERISPPPRGPNHPLPTFPSAPQAAGYIFRICFAYAHPKPSDQSLCACVCACVYVQMWHVNNTERGQSAIKTQRTVRHTRSCWETDTECVCVCVVNGQRPRTSAGVIELLPQYSRFVIDIINIT